MGKKLKKEVVKNTKGLTLIEVTIAMVIIIVMIVVVAEVYVNGMVQSKSDFVKVRLQSEGKAAVDGMTKNVKLASSIENTYSSYTSGPQVMILKIPAIDSSDNFIYDGGTAVYDRIVYYIDGENMHKAVFSTDTDSRLYQQNGSDNIILRNIKSFAFTYTPAVPNTDFVEIDTELEDAVSGNKIVNISLESKGRLRNVN